MISFECPLCSGRISCPEKDSGLGIPCPHCGKSVGVPELNQISSTPVMRIAFGSDEDNWWFSRLDPFWQGCLGLVIIFTVLYLLKQF